MKIFAINSTGSIPHSGLSLSWYSLFIFPVAIETGFAYGEAEK